MLRASGALLVSLAVPVSAPAEAATFHEEWTASAVTCFARSYDSQHLASHPLQRLTRFSLRDSTLGNPTTPGWLAVSLSFTLKGDPQLFQSEAFCKVAAGTVRCEVEVDGGRFAMRADGPNLLLTIERIEVEEPVDFNPGLAVGGDDRVVRLFPSPMKSCQRDRSASNAPRMLVIAKLDHA